MGKMLILTLLALVVIFFGQKRVKSSERSSYMLIFSGMMIFVAGILYFARTELNFYVGLALSVVYAFGISAVAAKYVLVTTKEASQRRKQSVVYTV